MLIRITFFSCCLLEGCTIGVTVDVFNSTESSISIDGCHETITIQSGELAGLGVCSENIIITESNGESFVYKDFAGIAAKNRHIFEDYLDYRPLKSSGTLTVQFQADGTVYVVKDRNKLPIKVSSHQPFGFPVKGKKN